MVGGWGAKEEYVKDFFLRGGGGEGAKEECVKEFFFLAGRHACGFLFNFSKVTENAIITIKLLIFSTAMGSENSPSLN